MKWVFFRFRRITELVIEIDGKEFRKILNLDKETIKVLKLMGEKYEKYMFERIVRKVGSTIFQKNIKSFAAKMVLIQILQR